MTEHIDPSDAGNTTPEQNRRALVYFNLIAATIGMPERDLAVFDEVVFGERTMTEAAKRLNIPRTTAADRFEAALAYIRRQVRNNPDSLAAFLALSELFGDK